MQKLRNIPNELYNLLRISSTPHFNSKCKWSQWALGVNSWLVETLVSSSFKKEEFGKVFIGPRNIQRWSTSFFKLKGNDVQDWIDGSLFSPNANRPTTGFLHRKKKPFQFILLYCTRRGVYLDTILAHTWI